jgi:hypothetical protein
VDPGRGRGLDFGCRAFRALFGEVVARPETIPDFVLAERPVPSASRSARRDETKISEAMTIIPSMSANPLVSHPSAHQGKTARAAR